MKPDDVPPPPLHPASGGQIMRAVPWLMVVGAFAAAFAVGMVTAWLIQLAGWWLHGGEWEHALLRFAQTTVSPMADPLFYFLPFIGTNYTLLPFVAAACAYLWYRGEHVTTLHLAVVQLGSLLLNVALKTLLARPRPDMYDPRGQHGLSAYPSGHSIAVTSVLLTVAWIIYRHGKGTWGFWVVGFIFIANNYSRIYLGVHWPTDVVGGVMVGGTWLLLTLAIFKPLHRRFGEP